MSRTLSSGVGRTIDSRYPSNRFILVAAPLAGFGWMVWKLVSEGDLGAAFIRALIAGGATFLAWAIARELDPDRPWTAGAAAALAAVVIGAGVPSLLVAGGTLLGARITARTTGIAPRTPDLVFVALFAVLVASSDHGLAAGFAIAAVLIIDGWLPDGARALSRPVGIGAAVAVVTAAALWGVIDPSPALPQGPEWFVVAVAVAGTLSLFRPRLVVATGDITGKPLSVTRVKFGRAVALAAALATFLWIGGPGLTSSSVVWSAMAASALPSWPRND